MPLEKIEKRIYDIYQEWHKRQPGVKPKEVGELGKLWAHFDWLMDQNSEE